MVDYHLVILVHGIWGNSSHLAYIEKQFNEHFEATTTTTKGDNILVYKTTTHAGYLTYDGIDINGKRISDEILEQTQLISDSGNKVVKFSIIGYSMGGLLARYAIGLLDASGYFNHIEPINYITICTPHIGVSNPQTHNLSVRIYNKVAPYMLLITGSQFFLKDKVGKDQKPLIVWMADPKSKFYAILKKFKYRSLYANVLNDKRCSWFTSFISSEDPVNSMYNRIAENIKCDYIKGYEPTIIDYSKPLHYQKQDQVAAAGGKGKGGGGGVAVNEKPNYSWFWKSLRWLKIISSVIVYTPFWALSFIISTIVQRIKMTVRLRKYNKDLDLSNKLANLYEYHEETSLLTNFSNKLEDEQETLVEDMYDAMSWRASHSAKFPKIKLSESQKYAVDKLNTLSWNKYPIIIRHTPATHAAAVVRHPDPTFDEGKVVVEHLLHETFRLE
ncbi:hypothetical protein KGF56_001313 [Candida oxycetoniae]|uniref:DUF676 domain-containing protein n=1 Tax=Candida oxycetoniae TaxID=497107 RepID=A0AAI9WYV5_9ASCO|nr:uncharacterized protein KGF56_001313 [Candida oxycetoniae]KAI3405707.2 hypothetical protein KGF56_001313 [Candida oxycetoniae]